MTFATIGITSCNDSRSDWVRETESIGLEFYRGQGSRVVVTNLSEDLVAADILSKNSRWLQGIALANNGIMKKDSFFTLVHFQGSSGKHSSVMLSSSHPTLYFGFDWQPDSVAIEKRIESFYEFYTGELVSFDRLRTVQFTGKASVFVMDSPKILFESARFVNLELVGGAPPINRDQLKDLELNSTIAMRQIKEPPADAKESYVSGSVRASRLDGKIRQIFVQMDSNFVVIEADRDGEGARTFLPEELLAEIIDSKLSSKK